MPRYQHKLVLTTGETREWEYEEGERPALFDDRREGYLMLSEAHAKGVWTTECIPWSQISVYRVKRVRSKPKRKRK